MSNLTWRKRLSMTAELHGPNFNLAICLQQAEVLTRPNDTCLAQGHNASAFSTMGTIGEPKTASAESRSHPLPENRWLWTDRSKVRTMESWYDDASSGHFNNPAEQTPFQVEVTSRGIASCAPCARLCAEKTRHFAVHRPDGDQE
jgi:hypothetical protein